VDRWGPWRYASCGAAIILAAVSFVCLLLFRTVEAAASAVICAGVAFVSFVLLGLS
jgi:hypothetical protein